MNRSRHQKHLIRVQADPQFVNCITDVANRQEHPQLFLQQIQLALDTAPEPPAPHMRGTSFCSHPALTKPVHRRSIGRQQ